MALQGMAKRRTARRRALPLRHRLPNAPAAFFGRESERAWLDEATERAPVCLVWGPGGLGKTSLVLSALAEGGARRTLFVHVGDGESATQTVARALARAEEVTDVDWAGLAQDADGLAALIVDLAEEGEWRVVVDDVHHAPQEDGARLLEVLAGYCRASRWVVTSRMDPQLTCLAGQVLALKGLPEADLEELAAVVCPGLEREAIRRAVGAAVGSPLRLLRGLLGVGQEPTATALTEGLSADGARLIGLLAAAAAPVPRSAFEGLLDIAELVPLLVRGGLVESSAAELRLHDVTRGAAEGDGVAATRADVLALGAALSAQGDASSTLLAARLYRGLTTSGEFAALLRAHGQGLLSAGLARALLELLVGFDGEGAAAWRLRCAVELGDQAALAELAAPREPGPREALAWLRALLVLGRFEEAAEQAAGLEDHDDGLIAFEATRLAALSRMADQRFDEALLGLERASAPGPNEAATLTALRAGCLVSLGESQRALETVRELSTRLPPFGARARVECLLAMGQTLYALGELDEAAKHIDALLTELPSPFALRRGRWGLTLRALVALDRGDLELARGDLARLAPIMRAESPLWLSATVADCGRRLAAGEHEGLAASLAEATAGAERAGSGDYRAMASSLATALATLRGEPATDVGASSAGDAHAHIAFLHAAARGEHLARHGGTAESKEEHTHPEARMLAHLIASRSELVADDVEGARREAERAAELAEAKSYGVNLARAHGARGDAMLVAGAEAELSTLSADLEALAERMGSRRFAADARFFATVAGPEGPCPGVLEDLAARFDESPVSARRARALLGAGVPLDEVDRRVLAALGARSAPCTVLGSQAANTDAAWHPAWGIDARRRQVWFADGTLVSLESRRLLFALLTSLAQRGGQATKEQLVCDAWQTAEYHPLRDDNRLHAAIRKLRRAIEVDPKDPRRVVRAEGGYALGGVVRWLPGVQG